MATIKVAVRVRPISLRELNLTGSEVVVRTDVNEISLTNLKVSASKAGDSRERTRRYGFDYCFDSSDSEGENYADQAKIYRSLGQPVLDAVFTGFNSCLVAYGQSASGKTYTMMGTKDDPGLTPRLCEGLFSRIEEERARERIYRVSVSYLEIYNERVRDLLKPSASTSGLKVREHPRLGPYVQGLTHHVVRTLGSLMSYVEEGAKARKTASTLQNPSSSRSHALLTVAISTESPSLPVGSSTSSSRRSEASPRGGSKLHLVDLAGSESAATCGGVHRLKEGANINKSLVALGNVISALAERGSTGSGPGRRFIPYRDSSLTWLLKDALGGNATTIMLATISPASGSYNETAHTLRFAQRAQSVVNRPVVNEDPVARIIRELRAEVTRLRSLLLEKGIEPESRVSCSCEKSQRPTSETSIPKDRPREVSEAPSIQDHESRDREYESEGRKNEEAGNVAAFRRFNSSESVVLPRQAGPLVKRFGSYEFLSPKDRFLANYNRAKVAELNDEEEDEIREINESVFVDIPTLVAVLIKPDDSFQESSTQIEEICSDEEFLDPRIPSGVNSRCASEEIEINDVYQNSWQRAVSKAKEQRGRLRKQDSIDIVSTTGTAVAATSVSSNLNNSKRFGSVETISRREPPFALERSHTNLERRSAVPDRGKKLNDIREIVWRGSETVGSEDRLERKGSNDSDKSFKESGNGPPGARSKSYARKPSLENLKRKTSKDSSSSSSKDEQILISSSTRDKLLRRKSSLEQEQGGSIRPHTPIQRARRSEIVAAVTERLYSSRKPPEENAASGGMRSPPEGTELKSGGSVYGTKTKLQELSRKMLGKRRRVCVDTQTESPRTVRMKDTASSTEQPEEVILRDVAVLTDDHEGCDVAVDRRFPVVRVKEIATLTDKPKTRIVRSRDVGSLANDLEDYDYETRSPRNVDSGILSDDTQNYAESNMSSAGGSDLFPENDRRMAAYAENSTNTVLLSPRRTFAVQTSRQDVGDRHTTESKPSRVGSCCYSVQEACRNVPVANPERNVISISVPDTISVTIESSNTVESRIAVIDGSDPPEEKTRASTRERETQTEVRRDLEGETETRFSFKDFTRSTPSQTDGRVFRIENIFQDPNHTTASSAKVLPCTTECPRMRNSVTFTNSLGTSYSSVSKQSVTNAPRDKVDAEHFFAKDGSITEAFVARKRSCGPVLGKQSLPIICHDAWKNWLISCPINSTLPIDRRQELGVLASTWQYRDNAVPVGGASFPCANCAASVTTGNIFKFGKSSQLETRSSGINEIPETRPPSCSKLEVNGTLDYEHGFSDDSLDYNENNVACESTISKSKLGEDCESRENFCPPDVVAHTKKDNSKCSSNTDKESNESTGISDFEESHVEFPRKKPIDTTDGSSIHDYKSLILGKPTYNAYETVREDQSDTATTTPATLNRLNNSGKKKVSFSSTDEPEKKQERESNQNPGASKENFNSALKSIIKKKKKKKNASETLNAIGLSNDETDDSRRGDNRSFASKNDYRENDWRESRIRLASTEETPKVNQDSLDSRKNSDESTRKKVKFSTKNLPEDECSEPNSRENVNDDDDDDDYYDEEEEEEEEEEDVLSNPSSRNILEEYLGEAVTLMRNMNSINEYMSATNMLKKCQGRGKRRGGRRRGCGSRNQDYVEFRGRRVSLKDDTEEYLKEDEDDLVLSTESYERCLKGIQRLEKRIRMIDEQNELLREKYGIDCESAGARLSLASPSMDPRVSSTRRNDSAPISGRKEISLARDLNVAAGTSIGSRLSARTNLTDGESGNDGNQAAEDDDIEKRIFHGLMRVADSARCSSSGKLRQGCFPRLSDIRSRSPTTYSKFREKFGRVGRESFCRDARGISNSEVTFGAEDDFGNFGKHRATERASDGRRFRSIDEDYSVDSMDEDDLRIDAVAGLVGLESSRERIRNDSAFLARLEPDDSSDVNVSWRRKTSEGAWFIGDDYPFDKLSWKLSSGFPMRRELPRNTRQPGIREIDERTRRIGEGGPTLCSISKETLNIDGSMDPIERSASSVDENARFRDKLMYPGSPRARFLELLRERRRIVESSRGTSAS